MGRPYKQTVDYFPHFANASEGKTLFILQSRFCNDGYACWFKILEVLANSDGHFFDYSKPADWQFLLARTGVSADTLREILGVLADLDAIDQQLYSRSILWVQKFVDNLAFLYKRRHVDFPRKPEVSTDINGISTDINGISTDEKPQSKVKYSKVNNNPLISPFTEKKPFGEFKNVLLTKEEHEKLHDRFNQETLAMIETLSSYIESTGKRYKSHYATLLSWAQRDQKETKRGKSQHSRELPKVYTPTPDYPDL